jgi:hypothetical protein
MKIDEKELKAIIQRLVEILGKATLQVEGAAMRGLVNFLAYAEAVAAEDVPNDPPADPEPEDEGLPEGDREPDGAGRGDDLPDATS